MADEALLRFSAAARGDLATLLMAASRSVNDEALAAIDSSGTSGVRAAHIPLIAALEPGGSRLVTLAARIGITRQAVTALARDLEKAGIVEIVADPTDARAQLVTLTDAGVELCTKAAEYLEHREAAWRAAYGEAPMDLVRSVLTSIANGDSA